VCNFKLYPDCIYSWVAGFSYTGGCGVTTNIDDIPGLPENIHCSGANLSFTYIATGECSSDECTSTFVVFPDDIPPTLVVSGGGDLGCDPVLPTCDDIEWMAIDNCPIEPIVTCTPGDIVIDGINAMQEFTIVATDACGLTDIEIVTFTWTVSCDAFCTLTQGFYGNAGGTYCDGRTTSQLLTDLLAIGPLTIGGASGSITVNPGEISCVYLRLPGGGTSNPIVGANMLCTLPASMVKKDGTINNSLIAQTLTMALNLRLDDELGGMELETNYFYTMASTECNEESAQPVPGTEQVYSLLATVMDALGSDRTIDHLFSLANSALNGDAVGVPLGDISNVLGMMNSALDECKFIYFCDAPCIIPVYQSNEVLFEPQPATTDKITLSILPNPFKDQTEIRFTLPEDSRVSLEVYNLYGARIATVFEGVAKAGFDYTYMFNPVGNNSEQVFLVVLRTNSGIITRRIINTY